MATSTFTPNAAWLAERHPHPMQLSFGRRRSDLTPYHDGSALGDASAALARTDFQERFRRREQGSPGSEGEDGPAWRRPDAAGAFLRRLNDADHKAIDAENEALVALHRVPRAVREMVRPSILTTSATPLSMGNSPSPLRKRTDVTMGCDELSPRARIRIDGSFGHRLGTVPEESFRGRDDLFGGIGGGAGSGDASDPLRSAAFGAAAPASARLVADHRTGGWIPTRSDNRNWGARPEDTDLWS